MQAGGLQYRTMARAVCAGVLACAAAGLAACAASTYAGIPLTAGAGDPELQSLARRAKAGDKHAQLELGIRYEEGRGVPLNLDQARRLYARAASTTGGVRLAYVPASSKSGRASTVPISQGRVVRGLPEAQQRLTVLGFAQLSHVTKLSSMRPLASIIKWTQAIEAGKSAAPAMFRGRSPIVSIYRQRDAGRLLVRVQQTDIEQSMLLDFETGAVVVPVGKGAETQAKKSLRSSAAASAQWLRDADVEAMLSHSLPLPQVRFDKDFIFDFSSCGVFSSMLGYEGADAERAVSFVTLNDRPVVIERSEECSTFKGGPIPFGGLTLSPQLKPESIGYAWLKDSVVLAGEHWVVRISPDFIEDLNRLCSTHQLSKVSFVVSRCWIKRHGFSLDF